ncbi:hypothetical protein [Pelosinus sp. IPA-1]|uniref:hypothetical protein n=1 Tax=Pelosinus sp. IPA-1 TaxID=3029569 RepID=UPI00243620C1|nr:hypothetical protein [Pelosinus sp. IPA-1]GMB01088.1 hypothetical protein PIPA1_38870 [Pelosinus sp. IPA-1]
MAEETVNTEVTTVTTEDKIAKLKTTLEGMELLGETIPQVVKDAVRQELATLEAEALAEVQKIEAETVSFYGKYRTEIIIVAALVILHVAGLFGV